MIWPWQRRKEARRQEILRRLYSERNRAPRHMRAWYTDMIMYAQYGKNRMNLPDDWGAYPPGLVEWDALLEKQLP